MKRLPLRDAQGLRRRDASPLPWRRALLAGALVVVAAAAPARTPPPAAGAPPTAIESCVDGQAIGFRAGELRAVLDAADAASVAAALLRRYPVVDRDGLAPQKILLWRKAGDGWLYVALLEDPARPGNLCFTASFVARGVDATPALVAKYFGAAAAGH